MQILTHQSGVLFLLFSTFIVSNVFSHPGSDHEKEHRQEKERREYKYRKLWTATLLISDCGSEEAILMGDLLSSSIAACQDNMPPQARPTFELVQRRRKREIWYDPESSLLVLPAISDITLLGHEVFGSKQCPNEEFHEATARELYLLDKKEYFSNRYQSGLDFYRLMRYRKGNFLRQERPA
ncbi:MAG: hypothetical protein HOE90_17745 [Bacteriovoracaceae bacterium]|jgi:hypothetical protein|nr:hypothetical protein [Bacteriovoracaceae bacterium]